MPEPASQSLVVWPVGKPCHRRKHGSAPEIKIKFYSKRKNQPESLDWPGSDGSGWLGTQGAVGGLDRCQTSLAFYGSGIGRMANSKILDSCCRRPLDSREGFHGRDVCSRGRTIWHRPNTEQQMLSSTTCGIDSVCPWHCNP